MFDQRWLWNPTAVVRLQSLKRDVVLVVVVCGAPSGLLENVAVADWPGVDFVEFPSLQLEFDVGPLQHPSSCTRVLAVCMSYVKKIDFENLA